MSDKPANKKRIKILAIGDTPACATGFGTVMRNILCKLGDTDDYEVDIIGINERGGWKDDKVYGKNVRIYPASTLGYPDIFGRPRLINSILVQDPDIKGPWDIVFTLNDPFVFEETLGGYNAGTLSVLKDVQKGFRDDFPPEFWFKTVSYWPLDSACKRNWYDNSIAKTDYPVAYCNYGASEINKVERQIGKSLLVNPLKTIYHGVNTDEFYPLPEQEILDFREKYSQGKIKKDTFWVSVVCRNQPRKDIPRAMKAFKEFQKRRPDSFLYIHAKNNDVGGTLTEYANTLGLHIGEDWGYPTKFAENQGYPIEVLNRLYNASDAVISTTLGEGFGLPFFEAMAAGTINIAADNSSIPELFNIEAGTDVKRLDDPEYLKKIRGIGVKSGTNNSEFYSLGRTDLERFRPLTNVDDLVQKLIWAYDNPDKRKQIEEQALDWVKQYTWDNIAKEWDKLFRGIFSDLEKERSKWVKPKGSVADKMQSKLEGGLLK